MKHRIYKLIRSLFRFLPDRFRGLLAEEIAPVKTVKTTRGDIRFLCNGRMTLSRFDEFFPREPDTREWIDSFADGDVFWDIGANVGIYSLYASLNPNIEVLSFEPGASNYAVLNKNIEINKRANIKAFCLAFGATTEAGTLYMQSTAVGKAGNSFNAVLGPHGEEINPTFRQGIIGYSIDDFAKQIPTHIKIDVDGIEGDIIKGAKKTLSDERCRSLMVELYFDRPDYYEILDNIYCVGFKLKQIVRYENHYFVRNLH